MDYSLDYFCTFSWPYSGDSATKASRMFEALLANRGNSLLEGKYEVSLVESIQGNFFVAVLVLTGDVDRSTEILKKLNDWFERCGVKDYEDYNHLPVRRESTDATLGAAYRVLKFFGTMRETKPGASIAPDQNRAGCALLLSLVSALSLGVAMYLFG
jgi:hypothetical protein